VDKGVDQGPVTKSINRLSVLKIGNLKARGFYADGGGLYLQVSPAGTKSWVFRFKVGSSGRYMGLGSANTMSLAEAREAASECRKLRLQGIDPIEHRKKERHRARLDSAQTMTFDQCRDAYIAAHGPSWKNRKHRQQWINTLTTYVSPVFGSVPVRSIEVDHVKRVLGPIWNIKPETASRLRGRIERILDWARASALRDGENPARWKGHVDQFYPARSKVRAVRHHPAIHYSDLPGFLLRLREQKGVAARALETLILTASRSSETLQATWDEIDFDARLWRVPARRMKMGNEHRVPLSDAALKILQRMYSARVNEFVFPGAKPNRPVSDLECVLDRMGYDNITVHGFRSTFRTWAAEKTGFQREVVETALAHVISSRVEAAYQRGDLFEKRRRLMSEWARYCAGTEEAKGEVVAFKAG
jgi:integrase